ncbi:DUF202 domain-containing protein [Rhodococcus sp. 06-156-3C]|uniref:YidH family protein n=1 Tax=Nocardiaceae TaxID=85025 RepID=UPI000522E469|nr:MULTISPECIES: DUF202 domain-containing protein [Rhodococcus]OZD19326.1 DUF202 domain-containing protein [Rhodococcus sp. 06-156-3C]OZD21661.1 DUF202 domain-containing protein [Rhodococcus sp. 06-156-4C]OZD25346.1 DUF202 domain-containing protein [Rhodococcus sp. 06-156-4a]OZD33039.1 DUF202 domain-containing protein [Rhodococcus sp. 06-156-3b]OZD41885.1 DUF202 domain-containing protein [Rhodococcus sp. 06-156-3]
MTDQSNRFPSSLYSVGDEPDPRFSFANERTFLAWIRTSLALMAGGIALEALPLDINSTLRVAVATALIATGIMSSIHAWWSWYRAEKAMRAGRPLPGASGTLPLMICLTVVGGAVGVAVLMQ